MIKSLTKSQSNKFPEYVDRWIKIGLSTQPADRESANRAIDLAYASAGLSEPRIRLWMPSPFAGAIASAMLTSKVFNQVRDQVGNQVWDQVGDQVEDQVGDQVWSQVWDQVLFQVLDQVRSQVGDQLKNATKNSFGGQLWSSGFCAYVSFFRDVMQWENETLNKFKILEDLTKSCGWVWWHTNVLSISDRPLSIHRDEAGRLHGEKGPSIAYRDGWSLYHWHGVSIPENWVKGNPPSPAEAINWPNIEQRRAACEIVGWSNILNQLDAKVIDSDSDVEIGTLLEVNLPGSGKEKFLKVTCGTGRENIVLPVPRDVKTALEANAWTYGIDDLKKFKPEVRT